MRIYSGSVIVMYRFLTLQAHAYICENISEKLIILEYRRVLLNGRILQYVNRPYKKAEVQTSKMNIS